MQPTDQSTNRPIDHNRLVAACKQLFELLANNNNVTVFSDRTNSSAEHQLTRDGTIIIYRYKAPTQYTAPGVRSSIDDCTYHIDAETGIVKTPASFDRIAGRIDPMEIAEVGIFVDVVNKAVNLLRNPSPEVPETW